MLTVLREILVRYDDDASEELLHECEVENDIRNMRTTETTHRERYFRQAEGGMRAKRAEEIESGVFRLANGRVAREVKED